MENDWLFSNEDEVDQEELEVALYSQIHFDPVTDNLASYSSNNDSPDLDFVRPSFQVKVRNYIHKKTGHSGDKVKTKKPAPCNLDFISLSCVVENSDDNDDVVINTEDKTIQEENPVSKSTQSPVVLCDNDKDADKKENENETSLEEYPALESPQSPEVLCDNDESADKKENEIETSQGEKSVSNSDPQIVVGVSERDGNSINVETKDVPGEEPISELDHSLIVIGDSDNDDAKNSDGEDNTSQREKSVSKSDPPTIICDSNSDDESDEDNKTSPAVKSISKISQSPIVVEDSDSSDSDDDDGDKATVVLKYQDSDDSVDNNDAGNNSEGRESPPIPGQSDSASVDSKQGSDSDYDIDQEIMRLKDMTKQLDSLEAAFGNISAESDNEQEESGDKDDYASGIVSGSEGEVEAEGRTRGAPKAGKHTSMKTPVANEQDDKWAISKEDRLVMKTPVNRYFNPYKIRCRNCNEEGHLALFCTQEKKIVCIFCGDRGHRHLDCPVAICFKCCNPGHKPSECTEARRNRYIECYRCWLKGHIGKACPDQWRQYHRTVGLDSRRIKKSDVKPNKKVYCYNCGEAGHLGFECDAQRMGLYVYPSYPFVAEYDKGRINRSGGRGYHREEEEEERSRRQHSSYGGRDKQDKHSHRRGKRRDDEEDDDDYYRREKHREMKESSSPRKRKHSDHEKDKSHKSKKHKGHERDVPRKSKTHKDPEKDVSHKSKTHKDPEKDVSKTHKDPEKDVSKTHKDPEKDVSHKSKTPKDQEKDVSHKSKTHKDPEKDVSHKSKTHKDPEKDVSHKSKTHKDPEKDVSHKSKTHKDQEKDVSKTHKDPEKDVSHKSKTPKDQEKDVSHKNKKQKVNSCDNSPETEKPPEEEEEEEEGIYKKRRKRGKKAGKKRKADTSEDSDRRVVKSKKVDTAPQGGVENFSIQINHQGSRSSPSTGSVEKCKSTTDKRKKYREEERRQSAETFASGNSVFRYQEPTYSRYAENSADSYNPSQRSAVSRYGGQQHISNRHYDDYALSQEQMDFGGGHVSNRRYDEYALKQDKISFERPGHNRGRRKGRERPPLYEDELQLMREEGEIDDYADDMLLEYPSQRPPHSRRRRFKRGRQSPVSFIGLLD